MSAENRSGSFSSPITILPEKAIDRRQAFRKIGGALAVGSAIFSGETAYFLNKGAPSDIEIARSTQQFAEEENVTLSSGTAQDYKNSLEDEQEKNFYKGIIAEAVAIPLTIAGAVFYLRNRGQERNKTEQ